MKNKNKTNENETLIQWHSAFRGAMKVELSNEEIPLMYRDEHPVAKKPLNIDLLIIQKISTKKLKNSIGHLFRVFNIMEYKGPDDSLSINDFYKVYAYACIFKSDTTETLLFSKDENEQTSQDDLSADKSRYIPVEEITITMVSSRYPRKLFSHLKNVRHFKITEYRPGIFHIDGDFFPIQIVVVRHLDLEEHAWLKALSKQIEPAVLQHIVNDYETGIKTENKAVVVDAILKGNPSITNRWKEEDPMAHALFDVFCPDFKNVLKDPTDERTQVIMKFMAKDMAKDMAQDMAQENTKKIVLKMLKNKMSYKEIAEITELDIDTIKAYELEKHENEKDN